MRKNNTYETPEITHLRHVRAWGLSLCVLCLPQMKMWISDHVTGTCSRLNCCHVARGRECMPSIWHSSSSIWTEQQFSSLPSSWAAGFALWIYFVSLCLIVDFFLAGGRALFRVSFVCFGFRVWFLWFFLVVVVVVFVVFC